MGEAKAKAAKRKQSRLTRQVKLGGKSLTLRFNYTALDCLEDLYDQPIAVIGRRFAEKGFEPRLRDVQRLIYAGLRTDHDDVTFEDVRLLLDDAAEEGRSLQEVLQEAFEALNASQPDEPEGGAKDPAGETGAG